MERTPASASKSKLKTGKSVVVKRVLALVASTVLLFWLVLPWFTADSTASTSTTQHHPWLSSFALISVVALGWGLGKVYKAGEITIPWLIVLMLAFSGMLTCVLILAIGYHTDPISGLPWMVVGWVLYVVLLYVVVDPKRTARMTTFSSDKSDKTGFFAKIKSALSNDELDEDLPSAAPRRAASDESHEDLGRPGVARVPASASPTTRPDYATAPAAPRPDYPAYSQTDRYPFRGDDTPAHGIPRVADVPPPAWQRSGQGSDQTVPSWKRSRAGDDPWSAETVVDAEPVSRRQPYAAPARPVDLSGGQRGRFDGSFGSEPTRVAAANDGPPEFEGDLPTRTRTRATEE